MDKKPLLLIEDLWVRFHTRARVVEAVRGVNISMGREKVGIVGESGSGKTVTGRSVLRLIRPPGEITAKRIEFNGEDLMAASEARMRSIRGDKISMVMQDPKFSLNPVMSVATSTSPLPGTVSASISTATGICGHPAIRCFSRSVSSGST